MSVNTDPCQCFCHSYYVGFPPGCMCKCRFININPFVTQQINGTNIGDYMEKKELSKQEICFLLGKLSGMLHRSHEIVIEISLFDGRHEELMEKYVNHYMELWQESKQIFEKIALGYCYT